MPKVSLQAKAPEFNLPAFDGTEIQLASYRNKKNVLLVFNRGFT